MATQARENAKNDLEYAKKKLARLEQYVQEEGPNYRVRFAWQDHNDAGMNTVSERVEHEKRHIAELEEKIAGELTTNIQDKNMQLEEVRQRPQAPPGGAPKGSRFFPLPKGHFDGQIYQYHRSHESSSRAAHQGVDLVEKYPFGPNPAIDVVAVVGGEAITDRYVPNLDYLAGIMIKGDDGYDQRYLHMIPSIAPGDRVEAGQVIGKLVDMRRVGRSIDDTTYTLRSILVVRVET